MQWVVLIFEYTFVQVALQQLEEERNKDGALLSPNSQDGLLTTSGTQSLQRPTRHRTRTSNPSNLGTSPELPESGLHMSASTGNLGIRRAVSSNSLNSLGKKLTLLPSNTYRYNFFSPLLATTVVPSLAFSTIYIKIWQGLCAMEKDPHVEVANVAKLLLEYIRNKVIGFNRFIVVTIGSLNCSWFQTREIMVARESELGQLGRAYTYSTSSNDSMDKSMFTTS